MYTHINTRVVSRVRTDKLQFYTVSKSFLDKSDDV